MAAPEKAAGDVAAQYIKPARQGLGIYSGDDGYLYCDGLRIDEAREQAKVRATAAGRVWACEAA